MCLAIVGKSFWVEEIKTRFVCRTNSIKRLDVFLFFGNVLRFGNFWCNELQRRCKKINVFSLGSAFAVHEWINDSKFNLKISGWSK